MEPWTLDPIATVHSPFQEKFGIPRQSGLTTIPVTLKLHPERVLPSALQGIEDGTHLWLIFGFHAIEEPKKAASVRPPRLGGNERRGVYGTRSPFRPNRLGLSLVRLCSAQAGALTVQGADLLDGTPVFDIKPFVGYCDTPTQAQHWAQAAPQALAVHAAPELRARLDADPKLATLWQEVQDYLRWDPRPAYRPVPDPRAYHQRFRDHEIHFRRTQDGLEVHAMDKAPTTEPRS